MEHYTNMVLRCTELMKREGYDALILTKPANMYYLTGAYLANIIWDSTICPDGTNSDTNADTCEGHLRTGPISCNSTAECIDVTEYCNSDSVCVPRTLGVVCSLDTECVSGFCVDGYCCESLCDGANESCDSLNLAGVPGFCLPTQ